MTFDIGLHEGSVQVVGRAGVLYVITKFSQMNSLPNFVTNGGPLRALRARESSATKTLSILTQVGYCKIYVKGLGLIEVVKSSQQIDSSREV